MVFTVIKMDLSSIIVESMKRQRELLKSKEPDNQLHCKLCGRIIKDDEGYYLKKIRILKYLVTCDKCK